MGFTRFEQFFRAASGVNVDRDGWTPRWTRRSEIKAVRTEGWERAFRAFRLLI
jgi:hypothetical protein